MCLYGNYRNVNIINPNQNKSQVAVDACISEEIQELNDNGIITLGCCCGHGLAGQIVEHENGFGKWKDHVTPPHTLISGKSNVLAKQLGYKPIPYYYADGEHSDVWMIFLKSGCVTIDDCKEWHEINNVKFEKNLGFV